MPLCSQNALIAVQCVSPDLGNGGGRSHGLLHHQL